MSKSIVIKRFGLLGASFQVKKKVFSPREIDKARQQQKRKKGNTNNTVWFYLLERTGKINISNIVVHPKVVFAVFAYCLLMSLEWWTLSTPYACSVDIILLFFSLVCCCCCCFFCVLFCLTSPFASLSFSQSVSLNSQGRLINWTLIYLTR